MTALHANVFAKLAELTPPEAASSILTSHSGDAHRAERDVWDTWQKIVGGEPANRQKEAEGSEEARFCVAITRHIADGTERPAVERTTEPSNRRRRLAAV